MLGPRRRWTPRSRCGHRQLLQRRICFVVVPHQLAARCTRFPIIGTVALLAIAQGDCRMQGVAVPCSGRSPAMGLSREGLQAPVPPDFAPGAPGTGAENAARFADMEGIATDVTICGIGRLVKRLRLQLVTMLCLRLLLLVIRRLRRLKGSLLPQRALPMRQHRRRWPPTVQACLCLMQSIFRPRQAWTWPSAWRHRLYHKPMPWCRRLWMAVAMSHFFQRLIESLH